MLIDHPEVQGVSELGKNMLLQEPEHVLLYTNSQECACFFACSSQSSDFVIALLLAGAQLRATVDCFSCGLLF